MLIETVVVGLFECNCTIIGCEETKEAIVIDPGDEAEKILEILRHYDLKLKYLVHTHAHLDHIMATREIKEKMKGDILLHPDDNTLYETLKEQASMFGLKARSPLKVDRFINDGEIIKIGNKITAKVIHTPGHSPGSICFNFDNDKKPLIFSGDTLFAGSIGRTDLWGGSYAQLIKSVKDRIFSLEESTVVCPGHGPQTSVWEEKKYNPFFR